MGTGHLSQPALRIDYVSQSDEDLGHQVYSHAQILAY